MTQIRNVKVVQVVGLYYPAPMYGTALVAKKIAESAQIRGFNSYVLTTDLESFKPYRKLKSYPSTLRGVSIKRMKTIYSPKLYPYVPVGNYGKLSELLDEGINIIHVHTFLDLGTMLAEAIALFKRNCRIILQPHFHPFPGGSFLGFFLRKMHDKTIGSFIVKKCHMIIVMSEIEKEALCELGANHSKIRVIHHGIEFQQIGKRQKRMIRENLGIMEKAKIIVCVSRIDMEIIRFFVQLLNQLDANYVAILAGGTAFESLENVRKAMPNYLRDRIILAGYLPREELNAVYEIGHYFVKPTHYEAFGIAFIEAMFAGLPVLSYRVGALPEIIEEGKNGFLFDLDNADAIAKKIRELQKNKKMYNEISERNRKKAKQYNWDTVLEQYMKIYEELAEDLRRSKLKGKNEK